jgi:hypothetical protein
MQLPKLQKGMKWDFSFLMVQYHRCLTNLSSAVDSLAADADAERI